VRCRLERALWLVAPVLIAGLAHVGVIALDVAPALARPIDCGRRWRGRELLGRNKTWRGFVVMPLGAAMTVTLQDAVARRAPRLATFGRIRSGAPPAPIVGAICGLAYVVAELPNSFTKRRLGIAPGARTSMLQYVIDQFDSVIGCVIAVRAFYRIGTADALAAGIVGGLVHVLVERGMHLQRM
jgi:CDP-2,3-bis-(O-geranylgeranyl)-sn-glycerol synthase